MEFFKIILGMSITGSTMFFIFLIIKPLTKRNFSSLWHYNVLILILIFFILPVGKIVRLPIKLVPDISMREIKEPGNLDNMLINEDTNKDIDETHKTPNAEGKQSDNKTKDENIALPEIEGYNLNKNNFNINSYRYIIQYIWIFGMFILFLLKTIPYIKFKTAIKQNSLNIEGTKTLELFNKCKTKLKIKGKVSLKTCKNINTPMLIGIFSPIILIPDVDENEERLKMIFLHELSHYKRKDIIIKMFAFIVNIVHWFNPIIYILLSKIDIYCEYSIDERVVSKMEIEDRKYYGETILKLIDNSIVKKNVFTTAMSSGGKELKARLRNMLFSKKMSKAKAMVSLVLMLSMVVSGFAIGCTVIPAEIENINYPFVVYIKEDGLYFTYLNKEEENKIQNGNGFEYPLISKDGNYIAYTNNNSLYIYDVKAEKYEKIADEIEHYYTSYDWIDDTTIIYGSTKTPGFAVFNVSTKEKTEHLDEYYYSNFKVADTKAAYARKENRWTTDEGEFVSNDGIVEINLNDYDSQNNAFATNIIVEGRKSTEEMIGYNPVVWNITGDGKYIYIMEKPASGSLSADGVGIGIYDVDKREHTELADITTLSYKNHLAITPKDNNLIGLIEGAGREMIENKEVVLLNIEEDKTYKTINFMEEGLVAMTPSFTPDGEKLLYSATKNLKGISAINLNDIYGDIYTDVYEVWEDQPHNIYEYDLKTSTTRKITEGDNFDFMPISISENMVLFSRYKGNQYYSLIILIDGKESILADNIIFRGGSENYEFGFYGYTQTERGLDIFVPEAFNNIVGWNDDFKKVETDNTERSSSLNIIDLNNGKVSPEVMKLAIEKVAKDNKNYNNTYLDG